MRPLWLPMRPIWLGVLAACATTPDPVPEPCEGGLDLCDAACVDLGSDDAHCGACGEACHAQQKCEAGECVPRCPGAFLYCDGLCVDLLNDTANCGSCGNACGGGEACVSGSCKCPGSLVRCDDACVDTTMSLNH